MTKREIQKYENMLVEQAWEIAKQVYLRYVGLLEEKHRLDYCKAWIGSCEGYVFLVSYNTMVAFIDYNGNLYDVLRLVHGYTTTPAKHIAKFRNQFSHVSEHTWREVNE